MYSWEIEELLKNKNYLLTYKEFLEIIRNSNQIDHIKYNPFDDSIEMWSNDNKHFVLKIRRLND